MDEKIDVRKRKEHHGEEPPPGDRGDVDASAGDTGRGRGHKEGQRGRRLGHRLRQVRKEGDDRVLVNVGGTSEHEVANTNLEDRENVTVEFHKGQAPTNFCRRRIPLFTFSGTCFICCIFLPAEKDEKNK